MATLTLSRKQVQQLVNFCKRKRLSNFFIAKDQGAYIGASTGKDKLIFYFKGCNPDKDANWHENCQNLFGGDDFGEDVSALNLSKALKDERLQKFVFSVTASRIKITFLL